MILPVLCIRIRVAFQFSEGLLSLRSAQQAEHQEDQDVFHIEAAGVHTRICADIYKHWILPVTQLLLDQLCTDMRTAAPGAAASNDIISVVSLWPISRRKEESGYVRLNFPTLHALQY